MDLLYPYMDGDKVKFRFTHIHDYDVKDKIDDELGHH